MGDRALFDKNEYNNIIATQEKKQIMWAGKYKQYTLKQTAEVVMYRGYWSHKNRTQISTLGEILFPDGRIYRGEVNDEIGMTGKGVMIF